MEEIYLPEGLKWEKNEEFTLKMILGPQKRWKNSPVEPFFQPFLKYPLQVAFFNNGLIDPRRGGVSKNYQNRAEKGTLFQCFLGVDMFSGVDYRVFFSRGVELRYLGVG